VHKDLACLAQIPPGKGIGGTGRNLPVHAGLKLRGHLLGQGRARIAWHRLDGSAKIGRIGAANLQALVQHIASRQK
jgi:hypothetical protein